MQKIRNIFLEKSTASGRRPSFVLVERIFIMNQVRTREMLAGLSHQSLSNPSSISHSKRLNFSHFHKENFHSALLQCSVRAAISPEQRAVTQNQLFRGDTTPSFSAVRQRGHHRCSRKRSLGNEGLSPETSVIHSQQNLQKNSARISLISDVGLLPHRGRSVSRCSEVHILPPHVHERRASGGLI